MTTTTTTTTYFDVFQPDMSAPLPPLWSLEPNLVTAARLFDHFKLRGTVTVDSPAEVFEASNHPDRDAYEHLITRVQPNRMASVSVGDILVECEQFCGESFGKHGVHSRDLNVYLVDRVGFKKVTSKMFFKMIQQLNRD
jgi:hypothetical protein